MITLRRLFSCQLSLLLLAGVSGSAQSNMVDPSGQSPSNPPSVSEAQTTSTADRPEITVTGKVPVTQSPLPTLPPDEFSDCMARGISGPGQLDPVQMMLCDAQRKRELHIVFEACVNPNGATAPPRVIQACTELLDRKTLEGRDRYPLFVNRARAYFAQGDKQRALDDCNEAVRIAPHIAKVYYSRGIYYAAQADDDAALRDFDAAIGISANYVPALRQRAKIYQARGNFSGALADYSQAILLEPKTAALWSERGYVFIRQRDFQSAVKDEAQAIQLNPQLARAYFLRGAAFGDLGDSRSAIGDLVKAVDLDPSLDRYVTSKGKTASIALPPL